MSNITADFFIAPNADIVEDSPDLQTIVNLSKERLRKRWQTQEGLRIADTWKANQFDRAILDKNVGTYYGQTDIRGIDISGAEIGSADLSNVDLYGANLEGAKFSETRLDNAWLSESNIKGAQFEWTPMDNVLLDNVEYDKGTSFRGVNLAKINFTLAAMLHDLAIGQQRIQDLETRHRLLSHILRITCDYGRSFRRFAAWCIGIVLAFAMLYWSIPGTTNASGFWLNAYFSISTFTTLGYADLVPTSALGRLLVVIEVILGYAMSGLLIAILARRIIGS